MIAEIIKLSPKFQLEPILSFSNIPLFSNPNIYLPFKQLNHLIYPINFNPNIQDLINVIPAYYIMAQLSHLKGNISIPRNKLSLFNKMKLYHCLVGKYYTEREKLDFQQIGQNIYIIFQHLPMADYEDVIQQDLIDFCKKFTPGTIQLNLLLLWEVEGEFMADTYVILNNNLIGNRLSESQNNILFNLKTPEITS